MEITEKKLKSLNCKIHKNKVVEAVCLENNCLENPLGCLNCWADHKNHFYSNILLDDFFEIIRSNYNVSYLKNNFQRKINILKSLKDSFSYNLNLEKEKLNSLFLKSQTFFNKIIDQEIGNIKQQYEPSISSIQHLQNFNDDFIKHDESVLLNFIKSFRLLQDEKKNTNIESEIIANKYQIQLEFIPDSISNDSLQYPQQISKNFCDELHQNFRNFESVLQNCFKLKNQLNQEQLSEKSPLVEKKLFPQKKSSCEANNESYQKLLNSFEAILQNVLNDSDKFDNEDTAIFIYDNANSQNQKKQLEKENNKL